MAQPSVASFFNTRKRAIAEGDAVSIKNRRLTDNTSNKTQQDITTLNLNSTESTAHLQNDEISQIKAETTGSSGVRTRSGRIVKRTGTPQMDIIPKKSTKKDETQTTLVPFIKKGPLTPRKDSETKINKDLDTNQLQKFNEVTPSTNLTKASIGLQQATNGPDQALRTPTKQIIKGSPVKHGELKRQVRKELNFDEVKTKITRSAKLSELKASLARIKELEKTRQAQEERNRRLREGLSAKKEQQQSTAPVVQLKEFDKIELEVLTSPAKVFKTPTKQPPPTPDKNELMSPRHTDVSKRILFSPAKAGSPSKLIVPPAYQRFQSLVETGSKAGKLPLPFKYRHLIDIFKGLDSVCAMFHNRKECITFKKLKPTVQRMLRKNLNETHLAQIKHIYPDAFLFTQMKMRNYGSTSKADYFQLVITPNVENSPLQPLKKIDEENILDEAQNKAMNPHIMTKRLQRFQNLLLEKVKDEHDKFLKTLDPPISIPKEKVMRWHPDFDLENCPDIECAHLPQAPNVEKYSSARDILSTARNLFNCATPMERAMERYEAKMAEERCAVANLGCEPLGVKSPKKIIATTTTVANQPAQIEAKKTTTTVEPVLSSSSQCPTSTKESSATDSTSQLLKGLPKSLLDKIRAKQAAKALDAMTRRPSQDQEATKYSRLPELARHIRNVFITERKGVLPLELVIKKIQNSFRTSLSQQEIEDHLRLMSKEVPSYIAFHEVRKTMYLKIAKDMDLSKIVKTLEEIANEKSK